MTDPQVAPVATLVDLFADLDSQGVRWCHWKSNSHLAAAVRGETDLDLLVARSDAPAFRQTVERLGFKPLLAAPGKHYPSVENHLGFDPGTGRLLHLHVHFQLVLGQQFVKDHRLPVEDWVLDSIRRISGVAVPSPEVELLILVMRAALKYRLRDALKDSVAPPGRPRPRRRPGLPPAIAAEIRWLYDQTSPAGVAVALKEAPDPIPTRVIESTLELLLRSSSPGWELLRSRQRLRRELRPYRRLPRWRATAQYVTALTTKRARRSTGAHKKRMTLRNGGLSIAVVGADGAGKSTLVGALEKWLGWRLDVRRVYMGNSVAGPSTRALKLGAKAARSAHRRTSGFASAATHGIAQLLTGLRRANEATERHDAYVASSRAVADGAVVLFDRYPLTDVAIFDRSMDGPRLGREVDVTHSRLLRRLAEKEASGFSGIHPPDRILVLKVSPEVALGRKPDHDPDAVAAKTGAIAGLVPDGETVVIVDADRPFDEVLAEAKSVVWTWL